MKDFALLVLRLAFGGLMSGHGAQKLFGWFGGGGLEGTEGMVKSMGMQPTKPWALLAGLSEFGGGLLTLLGSLNPLGPLATIGAMAMATAKAHWGKPIWNMKGALSCPSSIWLLPSPSAWPAPANSLSTTLWASDCPAG